MKHIDTIQKPCLKDSLVHGGCGECQASCQSACKTSCTVANRATLAYLWLPRLEIFLNFARLRLPWLILHFGHF